MGEGQLRCVGSSLFLKKRYGVGYNLTVEKMPPPTTLRKGTKPGASSAAGVDDNVDARLINVIKGAVHEASLLSNVGNEISFQLPIDSSDRFPDMFTKLDEMADCKNISTYGVGITTLEEVFLMVARGDTMGKAEHLKSARNASLVRGSASHASISSASHTGTSVALSKSNAGSNGQFRSQISGRSSMASTRSQSIRSEKSFRSDGSIQGSAAFSRHVQALFAKRAMNFKRDKKAWCCSTICPSLFALIGFLVVGYAPTTNRSMPPVLLTLDNNNPDAPVDLRNPIPFNQAGGEFSCRPGTCIGIVDNSATGSEFTDENYYFCGESAEFGTDESTCNDEGYCGPTCTITDSNAYVSEINDDGSFPVPQDVETIYQTSLGLANSSSAFAATQYGALYVTHDMSSVVDTSTGDAYSANAYEACVGRQQTYTDASQCILFEGIGYTVSTNFTSLHASVLYQAVADEAIIRSATAKEVKITPTIHPLPITRVEEAYASGEDAFTAWFLLVVSFPFIAGAFGTFVVAERSSKAKHLQTVSGVKPSAYWLSTYFWDVLNYQLPLWIVVALMYATGLEAFTTNDRGVASGTVVTLILFGPAAAGFTYCVSFAFKSPSMCNLFSIIFGFLIGMVPAVVVFILRLIAADPNGELQHFLAIAQALEWILRLFPPFNLAKGLFFAINIETFSIIYADPEMNVWSPDGLLFEVIFLAFESVVYIFLAIWIDKLSTRPSCVQAWKRFLRIITCRCFCDQKSGYAGATETLGADGRRMEEVDEDVDRETERVLSGAASRENIVIQELTKVYDNGKRAVDNLSLGIPSGECFGLLGINGAGKTSTMAMLTAEFPPTSGDAFLGGYSVTNQPEETRRRIGYCPQFDAHFANMTGREHVELYASIKGVPKASVKAAAAAKLQMVGLSKEDSNRLSTTYSGGMKRKLSVACATIGEPQTVFLDEPSTVSKYRKQFIIAVPSPCSFTPSYLSSLPTIFMSLFLIKF